MDDARATGAAAKAFLGVAVGLAVTFGAIVGAALALAFWEECFVAATLPTALAAFVELSVPGRLTAMLPLLTVKPLEGTFTAAAVRSLAAGWPPAVVAM
jgi:hypothetical protein